METLAGHFQKREKFVAEVAEARRSGVPVRLGKSTSNLFRRRERERVKFVDARQFDQVLQVDCENLTADVEGMMTFEAFADETLKFGLLPPVVPQLKTITLGGAVSGLGIESSSFRFGLVHETLLEMDILTGAGEVVTCSAEQNPDLFHGFPNSYGTLGYALRLRTRLIPAKRYVHLQHDLFGNAADYFGRIAAICAARAIDYLDGTIFSADEMYVTTGVFTEEAPRVSDYKYLKIYYQSIRRKREDWLTVRDYLWRWDTDWFWCSKQFGVQNPAVRLLAAPWALNSRTYQRVMRAASSILPPSTKRESVIQDVDIPIENAPGFLRFLLAEIGITPVWVCPFQAFDPAVTFPLYALDPERVYVNFGFWDVVATTHEPGYFNRKIERKMVELCGKKGLYSTAHFDEDTFWRIYNREAYARLKEKYDPDRNFQDLYAKCVLRK